MAKVIIPQSRFAGGIAYSEKEGLQSSFLFAKSIDYRSDPTKLKLLPKASKVSGGIVTDLILDADRQGSDVYSYGDTGNIYKRTSAESWTLEHTVNDSHGNGMKYFGEDSFLYYASDTVIGRYGPFGGTATFNDDFLGSFGGVPLNTHSLDLEAGSSHYATAADSATLSITGDISLEAYIKFESLPSVDNSMVFISKWNENGNQRSYLFELLALSATFGDSSDGTLTIASNTTEAPIDSSAVGTAAAYALTATNASFAAGQKVLIHQTRGTNAGRWERNEIASYTAGTITLVNALTNDYASSGASAAQVRVLKEYSAVTINSGVTYTAKAWNGTVGGILSFLCSGTTTVNGTISANGGNGSFDENVSVAGGTGGGFRGGDSSVASPDYTAAQAYCGEGTAGATAQQQTANGNGGGGALTSGGGSAGWPGGGGGHATAGEDGINTAGAGDNGFGGNSAGTTDLTTMVFGGGGGGGANDGNPYPGYEGAGSGGSGGGIIFLITQDITIHATTGLITSNGGNGGNAQPDYGGGGAGAGGSVLIKAQTATLNTNRITASAGTGGTIGAPYNVRDGGNGSVGRIHLDYYTSYTGTTSPTLNVTQDNTLVSTVSYAMRFGVSSNGTNEEFYVKLLTSTPSTSSWNRYGVTWDASASTAVFYLDGVNVGQITGALTAIYNGTALLGLGAKFDAAGAAESFLDGKIDDARIFNDIRTDSEMFSFKDVELASTTSNLQAYYQVDNSAADTTANANNLTLVNTPSYSTDVPFSSPTSRLDLDQSLDTSGQTYTSPTSISEAAGNLQSFVPAKDPQKSIEVNFGTKGTGAVTITVHDSLNREVASKTVANADLPASGDYEFTFSTAWRPIIGATYHFHLTSTVNDATVVTTTNADLDTADFHTYYQFLVADDHHPIEHHAEKLNIGNERYLATWDAITYNPHRLTLPSGFRIRCLGQWREYLVMGVTRGTNITDYEQGYLFFWDGYSTTYNFYVIVPEGGVNCIMSGDPMYFMAGYSGDLMKYEGGIPKKVRRVPKVDIATTLEFNRKAMAMWRALVHFGVASNSTSTALERGVYSYGTSDPELAPTLSFDYPLSLGITTGANLEIGMVLPIGSDLLVSWKNGTSYGVDLIDPFGAPAASGRIEFLITDAKKIFAEKQAQALRGYFKALASGDSMQFEYKIDRESSWVQGDDTDDDNQQGYTDQATDKEMRLTLPTMSNRFNELQVALEMATTATSLSSSPEFYGYGIEIDDLNRERRV